MEEGVSIIKWINVDQVVTINFGSLTGHRGIVVEVQGHSAYLVKVWFRDPFTGRKTRRTFWFYRNEVS